MSKIDVSKCKYFEKLEKFNFCNMYDCNCGDFNCDFKYEEQLRLIKQLEAENKELKEQYKLAEPLFQACKIKDLKIDKYKQCLDEIEKIANDYSFPSDFDVYEERDFYFNQLCKIDNILQKIKEVKEQ